MSSLTNILVHLDDGEICGERLELSAQLAQSYDAHLSALYVGRFLTQALLVDAPPSGMLIEALEKEQQIRTTKARELFESRTSNLESRREFHAEDGDPVYWLTLYGRYADVIVVQQPEEGDIVIGAGAMLGALALSCGRPVLVVPRTGVKSLSAERIMIAWNGSKEAARALADALPFLQKASEVEVVTVAEARTTAEGAGPSVQDVCRHLELHGIKAAAIELPRTKIKIADALLSRAAAQGADLVVLGAYGHSRFRELVLGGVTRHFLSNSAAPLLLSH